MTNSETDAAGDQTRRYVLLHHETEADDPRPSHWDLMVEDGLELATWAFERDPRDHSEQLVQQLPAHRILYLGYEGPISGNRGAVRRCQAGECEILEQSSTQWRIRFADNNDELILRHQSEACWSASLVGRKSEGGK